jgi:hypothetical protein
LPAKIEKAAACAAADDADDERSGACGKVRIGGRR